MDELLAIKDRAWEHFRALPGVHAVGIGKKVTGGIRTDEVVLTVFVTKKLSLHELQPEAVVPLTFEGVRTDIVERSIPQMLAAPVSVMEANIPNGKSFTFTTTVDPPSKGTRIVISLTWHGNTPDEVFVFHVDANGSMDLNFMLSQLQSTLTNPYFTAMLTGNTLAITPAIAGESLDASCYILMADRNAYAPEFLRGGILIQGGARSAGGTLGCLASLPPTAAYPQGRIVAVTCSHVVRGYEIEKTTLEASAEGNTIDLTLMKGAVAIRAHTLITVIFSRTEQTPNLAPASFMQTSVFYTTSENEALDHVAAGLADQINRAGLSGVTALPMAMGAGKSRITVNGFSAPGHLIDCRVTGPKHFEGLALEADVVKSLSGEHVVTFKGTVKAANLGIFVDIDSTGFSQTFGVYQNPSANQPLADVVQTLSTAINLWPASQRGTVSATAIGTRLTITKASSVRVWIEADIRIGQPIDFFQPNTAQCCNFRIGRVLDARLDMDVALIQLDSGLKYKHHIEELNAVTGTQTPLLGLAVQKRGFVTGVTEGMISAVATSGIAGSGGLTRVFRNAVVIDSTILDTGGLTRRAFALPGDSGAAVVTTGPGPPKLTGILFAGDMHGNATMTPVDDIKSGFANLGLSFEAGIGVDLNAVHTVPAAAMNVHSLEDVDVGRLNGIASSPPFAAFGDRIREVSQQMAATPVGRGYADLLREHFGELINLVNHNRRVATVWHRSGGPELLNAILRVLRFDDEPLPSEINGRPITECIERLRTIFIRYGSPQLSHDVDRLAGLLNDIPGMTYPQVLATLHSESGSHDVK